MALTRNVTANYIGTATTVVVPLFAIPAYLSLLGPAEWGLVSFAITLVALLSFVEVGLSQSLTRDFALGLTAHKHSVTPLFSLAERLYWCVSALGATVLAMSATKIADSWLNVAADQQSIATHCIWFAAWTLLCQLPSAVYRTVLVGAGSFVKLNLVVTVATLMRHGVGVLLLWHFRSVHSLLIWHGLISLAEMIWRRRYASRIIANADKVHRATSGDGPSIRASFAMSGAVLIAVLSLQLDRLILSHLAPIEALAYYNTAFMVANVVLQLGSPLIVALTAAFASASQHETQMLALCCRLLKWFSLAIALMATLYLLIGNQLLSLWLNSPAHAKEVKPILDVLLIGSAFNLVYQVGYQRWIALGLTRTVAIVNAIGLCCTITLTPVMIMHAGAVGAAMSWIVINVVGAISSLSFMIRRKSVLSQTPAEQ